MADTPEKTPRKRAALQVLQYVKKETQHTSDYVLIPTTFGEFESRADALDAIFEGGKTGVNYIIAESEPKRIQEQTRVSRKLV